MTALLLSRYRHLEIAEVPAPVPGPDDVLVLAAACGICGSDVHGYDGSSGRRILPMVMGHEAAGTAGAAVHNAVIPETVARMAYFALGVNPAAQPVGSALHGKHYLRKHGKNAYYGQAKDKQ
ncbi:MAG: alcohol dehydrogenase catalytic domain-containing protein [Candidatus Sulfotelmatobacter sp.]